MVSRTVGSTMAWRQEHYSLAGDDQTDELALSCDALACQGDQRVERGNGVQGIDE